MEAQNGITLYIQSGIIPFRRAGDHIEILLITNKKKDKWGIPKGLVEAKLSASESAQKEAFEEAGIYGKIYKPALGKYSIKKWEGKCRIKVFAMEVTQILDNWPEDILRKRQWYSVDEAAGMVKNKKLQAMIQGLPEYLEE